MPRSLHEARYSLDHTALLETLSQCENLLIIQDLDGVCMGLVSDPLTRRIERRYVEAGKLMDGHFFVLTNGEHIGSRGVNDIVERAFDTPEEAFERGLYLPGLAGGGVQLQDALGHVTHPGVSEAELEFLAQVPQWGREFLNENLSRAPYSLPDETLSVLVEACVLDNQVSPTLNINTLYHHFRHQPEQYAEIQQLAITFSEALLERAAAAGLGDSFFIHYAPNLGRVDGLEKPRISDGSDAGTTDFQFMLRGAVKEVGVLVLLNHYYYRRTGEYPLGEQFNAREAPADMDQLLALAKRRFDPAEMPCIVGVGDTVTSHAQAGGGYQRGGSDRGFLTLVQALGESFATDNACVFIDSSGGEVIRPGVDGARLESDLHGALSGITDPNDELRLNFLFTGGHTEYVNFFCDLATRRAQ
ncbi:glucosylglycerol 3-phosphatase [Marinobacterium mangrovicola]|uniref:Glucosylglycerol phosphatase n=1 Tax=Marinobacterium mangrovicola TaxID=1476959 RepID=A0A4R1GKH9_9GAMM|nr:glucosylglycerol 3-phosphatase [Marinobacterium mangrovicola]TCK08588.1 glucosylglycerol phosphatase [Marinobacterium mangrovicola]